MTSDLAGTPPRDRLFRAGDRIQRGRSFLSGVRTVERVAYLIGAALILAGLAHLIVALIYPRPWFGSLSWRKPVTFGVSFGTVLMSVTWVASYLRLVATLATFAAYAVTGRVNAPPAMRLALRAGFALLVAGLAAGIAMIVRGQQLIRSEHRTLAADER